MRKRIIIIGIITVLISITIGLSVAGLVGIIEKNRKLNLYEISGKIYDDFEAIHKGRSTEEYALEEIGTEILYIICLVLYHPHPDYDRIMEVQKAHLKYISTTMPNFSWYYYCYDSTVTTCTVDGNRILIPGIETFNPGIREKTYEAFKAISNMSYDYVVRINAATLVDFKQLRKVLRTFKAMGTDHCVAKKTILQWFDRRSGVNNRSLFGLPYPQGRCMVFNRETFKRIVAYTQQQKLTNVVDDVSIGIVLKNLGYSITDIGSLCADATDNSRVSVQNEAIIFYHPIGKMKGKNKCTRLTRMMVKTKKYIEFMEWLRKQWPPERN